MFDHISKHLEIRQKYSAARRIFNSLLGVWKWGQTRSSVFDILLDNLGCRCLSDSSLCCDPSCSSNCVVSHILKETCARRCSLKPCNPIKVYSTNEIYNPYINQQLAKLWRFPFNPKFWNQPFLFLFLTFFFTRFRKRK